MSSRQASSLQVQQRITKAVTPTAMHPVSQNSRFLSATENVAELRKCVSSCWGVKVLRSVCRATRFLALTEVKCCRIKLRALPSQTEPLLEVARLLKDCRLRNLRVDVMVAPCSDGPPKLMDLSSHTAQLQAFITIMHAALANLTSLELVVNYADICDGDKKYTLGEQISGYIHRTSKKLIAPYLYGDASAMVQIVSLLAAACPNVCSLGLGGWMGEDALKLAVTNWSKPTSLTLLDRNFTRGLLKSTVKELTIPHLTNLDMGCTKYFGGPDNQRICELMFGTSVLTLKVGKDWMHYINEWFLLPSNLQHLHCCQLFWNLYDVAPGEPLKQLHLSALRSINLSKKNDQSYVSDDVNIDVDLLAYILTAAPLLRSLSFAGIVDNTLDIHDDCTTALSQSLWQDLDQLQRRFDDGFCLSGITVCCRRRPYGLNRQAEPPLSVLPITQVLERLPRFSMFNSLTLSCEVQGGKQSWLSLVQERFPRLICLRLDGQGWANADVNENLHLTSLASLDVEGTRISSASLLKLASIFPNLKELKRSVDTDTKKLKAFQNFLVLLQAADTAIIEVSLRPRPWTLERQDELSTVWKRGN